MYKRIGKRLLDILIAVIGLPFFAIIYIIFAPIIYFTDKGHIFYNAPRLGLNGKIFNMYKFRSMKVNAPDIRNADGSTYNSPNDSRVTKIGRFMRKTSLDELPQLLNVLKGDMSIVGPRAFLTTKFKSLELLSDRERKRLSVRPGITGYSQAYFRNSASMDKKIEDDCYYVDHLSFFMDLKILFKTVESVLRHENIYISLDAQEKEGAGQQ